MSDTIEIPFGDNPGETATLLLAAAEELDLGPLAVATTSERTFIVPSEVAKKANIGKKPDETGDEKKPAKKTAQKTAKKSSSKE